jgi:hypothetical protein
MTGFMDFAVFVIQILDSAAIIYILWGRLKI